MGRRRDGNHTPPKNNPIQDSVGNEENGYPVSDPYKTMIMSLRNQVTLTKKKKKNPHKGNLRRNH
jgi:hypothetical protein